MDYHIKLWLTKLNNQLYGSCPMNVELLPIPKFRGEIMIYMYINVSIVSGKNETTGQFYVFLNFCHLSL